MKRIGTVATVLLAILALFSATSIVLIATNYREGMSAASNLRFELNDLELKEAEPEVAITFRLENASPLSMRLEQVHFSLYLNGDFVGSNYEPFSSRDVSGFEETELHFRIPLQPFYLQYVKQAREQERFSWSLRGNAKLILPFREDVVWLDLNESWSGE